MRFSKLSLTLLAVVFGLAALAPCAGQAAAPTPAHPSAQTTKPAPALRVECSKEGEFCVAVPVQWKRLSDVFEGTGFVVAEPGTGLPQEQWLNLTAAMIFLPEPVEGNALPEFDEVVTIALVSDDGDRSTLERSRREIAGREAQTARVRVHEAEGKDAVELLGFVRVDDDEVFSLALHCPPDEEARLAPVFERALASLKIVPQPAPPATPAAPAAPASKPRAR